MQTGPAHLQTGDDPLTCLKQKGMVSTLTPTMLFTTFITRPQLEAVILKASLSSQQQDLLVLVRV